MKCHEVHAVLNAYVDRELPPVKAQQVDEHLRTCAACTEEYRELTRLRNTINSGNIHESAPAHLKKQVSDSLKEAGKSGLSWPGVPTGLAFGFPALLLGLVIGWAAVSYLNTQQAQSDLLASLTSAHIRSLMVDHLTDIASSDSHTVKPWFHGRLDFSPPVHDLTRDGYPLIGGRLEYLAGSSAAALVYRHRQHTINLFIFPKPEHITGLKTAVYKGYNILNWSDESLSYWVISDLNLSDLEHFKVLFTSKSGTSLLKKNSKNL